MKRTYAVQLLKSLQSSGIDSVGLELFFNISDSWAREILQCEDIERRCKLIKFAGYSTQFMKRKYHDDPKSLYMSAEIKTLCGIKHLGVVLDLLSNGMIDRVPDDSLIRIINSATHAYQARYASLIQCNPELQKLGLAKLAVSIILKSSAEYKAKYETIAISCVPSMLSLEGICYIEASNTEFQAKSILDILCNDQVIDRELAVFGAKAISEAVNLDQALYIKNVICNPDLEVDDIKRRVAAILVTECNWEIVTSAYPESTVQQLPISTVVNILETQNILNANVSVVEKYYKTKIKITQNV